MKDLRKYIRKILAEQVLEEDYYSIKEISDLAAQALLHIAQVNMESLKRQVELGDDISYFNPIMLLDVYHKNPKKYPTLAEFITNSRIFVNISRHSSDSTRGSYTHIKEPEYDRETMRDITLYPKKDFFKEITEEFKKERQYPISAEDLYFKLWYAFNSTLEHEIQHAYDDFRSNSKLFQARKTKEYMKKHTMANGREANYADPERNIRKYKEYLKLQHEIWARFTQAISKTHFTTGDFAKTEDGVDYIHSTMKPLKDVLKDFRYNFDAWEIMPDSVKKKLYGRVSAYWHKEQENLDQKNKNSIEREREAKKKRQLAEVRRFVKAILNGEEIKSNNIVGENYEADVAIENVLHKALGDYFLENRDEILDNVYSTLSSRTVNWAVDQLIDEYPDLEPYRLEFISAAVKEGYFEMTPQKWESGELDEILNEDYPSSFDMEYFKTLKTFKERIAYCQANLERISSGSSRIAYKIDDSKVLKLAKNNKGITQNEIEIDRGKDAYYSEILAQVFDYDENGLWIEMELARKVIPREFFMITKFKIEDIGKYLINFQESTNGRGERYFLQKPLLDRLRNDEFVERLRDFVAGTDTLAGDLGRLSSYGIVKRDGEDQLVLIDFGLTDSDHEKLYRESINEDIIEEAPLRMESLPSTTGLFIMDKGVTIMMSLYDPESNRCYGYLTAADSMEGSNDYSVISVAAEKGFGPFVYELAMMYVNAKGKGLMPSRDGDVRGDAFDVWTKFYDRKDVKKNKLTPDSPAFKFAILFDDSEMEDVDDVVEFYTELSKEDKRILSIFNSAYFLSPNDVFNTLIKNAYICKQKNADCQGMAMKQASKLWNEKYDE